MFDKWSIDDWEMALHKITFYGTPLYMISWDEIIIQVSYRDEYIPEEYWPAANEHLNTEIFEEEIDDKTPIDLFLVIFDALKTIYKKYDKFLPKNLKSMKEYFNPENCWTEIYNSLDDFFYGFCAHIVDSYINSILNINNNYCHFNLEENMTDFIKLSFKITDNRLRIPNSDHFTSVIKDIHLLNDLIEESKDYKKHIIKLKIDTVNQTVIVKSLLRYCTYYFKRRYFFTKKIKKIYKKHKLLLGMKSFIKRSNCPIDIYNKVYKHLF